jgi:uncharacterized protein (DUF2267 family)
MMDDVARAGAPLGAPFQAASEDFFRFVSESGALPVGVDAGEASAAVVCALLARLDLAQAREVLDALPAGVAESIGRCAIHGGEVGEKLGKAALLARIAEHFQLAAEAVAPMAAAVFGGLRAVLPPRAADVVERELPADLRALWRGR